MDAFLMIMGSILVLGLLLLTIYVLLDFHAQKHGAASGSGRMLYPNACQKYSEVMNQPPVTDASTVEYYKNSYRCYYYNNSYNCYCNYYKSCCQKRSQTAIKATNPASSTTESSRHDTSRSSPYLRACQAYYDVTTPPPLTGASIVDYYYHFYCFYYNYYYPNGRQTESKVTNPPPLTAESFESGMSHWNPYLNAFHDYRKVINSLSVTNASIVDYYYTTYRYYYNYYYPNGRRSCPRCSHVCP